MTELILHHYAGSPFSEKIRLILGYKGLAWQGVTVPVICPKPDVLALTGGYRRTPFLQIGADIFCDSALIAEVVEARQPTPSLFPPETAGAERILAQWADRQLFWAAASYTLQPAGAAAIFAGAPPEFRAAFAADRALMTAGSERPSSLDAAAELHSYLSWLEHMLADGRPFLLGAAATLADFSVAQSIWFIRLAPPVASILEPHQRLSAWFERIAAFGHGQRGKSDSLAAIEIARSAGPQEPVNVQAGLGFEQGDKVQVNASDYARDPVCGELVGLNQSRISLRRVDERAGCVHVHFPRIGYALRKT
ncbi:glutathione S-transferase family protein [Roseateles oligotrophus]|uniref:Glutathione S-transferase family protein n=1 Tax=Roseateles oligotrophus TaxID=1769250 RepID=A0ABT2YGC0_9BURK|nr:glutathione S-transferase family protein [Roseateles oligotrophus]MCV2369094.1 glutathione S-transferase family protein [Roseateles oligotrophus]